MSKNQLCKSVASTPPQTSEIWNTHKTLCLYDIENMKVEGGGAKKLYHDTRSCRCNEEGIDAIMVGGRESRKNTIFSEIGSLMLYDIENMQVEGGGGQESRTKHIHQGQITYS